ncbi:MAG: hypothetical protein ACJAUG_001485 [Halioglobus sp.]|jgi:hypothetical protein
MTEAEAVMTFREFVGESNQLLFGYISFVSAFLVMSYFAAAKLHNFLAVIILAIFSAVALLLIFQVYLLNTDIDNLYAYIYSQKASGAYELSWFGQNPAWSARVLTVLQVLSTLGGYIGCMVFFFYQKSHGSRE